MNGWRGFALWFALALLVRAAIALLLPEALDRASAAGIAWDGEHRYLPEARALLAGEGLRLDGEPTARHVPGYPLLLAGALAVAPSERAAVLGLQLAFGALSAGAVFLLGTALLGARVGHLAAALATGFPDTVAYSLLNLSEGPHLLAVLACQLALIALLRADPPHTRRAALLGLALGAAILVRESSVVLLALWVGVLLWRRAGTTAATVLVVAVAVLLPWTVRNWIVLDRFVPLTSKGAVGLYQTTLIREHPVTDFRTQQADDPDDEAAEVWRRARDAASPRERDRILLDAAFENVAREPLAQVAHLGRKLVWLWSPNIGPRHGDRMGYAPLLRLASALYCGLLGLGLLGLWWLRARPDVRVVLALPLLAWTAAHLVIGGAEPRYHFALLPPLFVAAAAMVEPLLGRRRR